MSGQYFAFIGDELSVARDALSCQGFWSKIETFWGGVTVESGGAGKSRLSLLESRSASLSEVVPPKFRIPGLFWEREYLKYTVGWGSGSC